MTLRYSYNLVKNVSITHFAQPYVWMILIEEIYLFSTDTLHSVYKFGWCTRDSIVPQFLRKKRNYTLPDFKSADTKFIYVR